MIAANLRFLPHYRAMHAAEASCLPVNDFSAFARGQTSKLTVMLVERFPRTLSVAHVKRRISSLQGYFRTS